MPRYIDAHVAESLIAEMAREPEYKHEDEDWKMGLCMAERAISETPTADVVEVVRCKDCEFFVSDVCRHDLALNLSRADDFCSYGERKERG
jgi:hypothetical protein